MKTYIWHMTATFPSKVNFIDSNNVLLGYDLHQCCCENAFWTVSESLDGSDPLHSGDNSSDPQEISLERYVFDPDFYQLHEDEGREEYVAIFRLVGLSNWHHGLRLADSPDLYVRLGNHHNGYYSHGFTFSGPNAVKGSL
jgi:hypothetical protein